MEIGTGLMRALLLAGAVLVAAGADTVRQERIEFAAGATSATVEGGLAGFESVQYAVAAAAGQVMTVGLEADNASTYVNVYRPGDTTPTGQAPEVYPLPKMLDMLRPLYQQALAKAKAESTPEKKKGVGIAIGVYGSGLDGPDGAEAAVELTKEGVTVYATWQDHGQGADMGVLGTAHEALRPLELDPHDIKLVLNEHVDLGQGILDCLREIHQDLHHADENDDATPTTSDNRA